MSKELSETLQIHHKADFFIKIEKIPEINGLRISFPEKVIDLNDTHKKCSKIYESEKDKLTIYKNKKVAKVIDSPQTFHRPYIVADIFATCQTYNLSHNLYIVYDYKTNEPTGEKFNVKEFFDIPYTEDEKKLFRIFKSLGESSASKYSEMVYQYNLEEETLNMQDIIESGGI